MTNHVALKSLEYVRLDEVYNPRVLSLLEDLLTSVFSVTHVQLAKNTVSDYLNRLLSDAAESQDYPCLFHSFKAPQEVICVIQNPEFYDWDLLRMAKQGSDDGWY